MTLENENWYNKLLNKVMDTLCNKLRKRSKCTSWIKAAVIRECGYINYAWYLTN